MAFKYKDYEESESLKKLAAEYAAKKAAAPGAYKSGFENQMADVLSRINNREKFSYDKNTDPFYKQYEDIYKRGSNLAMRDTVGQASSLTGGYGNSYATTAGQQAYNAHMQDLGAALPELYQLAYSKYQQEGADLMDQYSLLAARDADAYARHRDTVGDYYTELDRLSNEIQTKKNEEYSRYLDDRETAASTYAADLDYDAKVTQAYYKALGNSEDEGDSGLYSFSRKETRKAADGDSYEESGNMVFVGPDGKEVVLEKGINPYTRSTNSDIKYGTFKNGYQPNHIVFNKGTKDEYAVKLVDTEDRYNVEGRNQAFWSTNDNGDVKYWLWNGRTNQYEDVTDFYVENFLKE